ncbi:MAG: DNA polymerase III subunit delta [Phycisphaeraceae bacterium]|nr:MAG: DNA polymerase III subunit delta [Phycisphaeraceae bacterium]
MAAKKKTTRKKAPAGAGSGKKSGVELGPAHRIVVLHGKEVFLRSLHTEKLQEKLVEAHGEVDVLRFPGKSTPVAEVLDECRSFGLMQQHKMVVVDEADQFVKEESRPLIERYAASPSEQATLVLRANTWNRGKLDKLIEKVGLIHKCEALTPAAAMKWTTQRCRKEWGATLNPRAAEALVERAGVDLGRLDSEMGKLAAAAGKGGEIGPDLVRELVGLTREEEAWSLQAEVLLGTPESALALLQQILTVSRQPEQLVSYALIDLARKLHTASRLLRAGVRGFNVTRAARIWGPDEQREAILDAARRVDPDTLAELLSIAIEADARMKSGFSAGARSLETLTLRFASATR